MNGDGKEKGLATNSLQRTTGDHTSQRGDTDKGLMEALGRGFSDLYRNSSEELILRSLMESPLGISSAPSLEMLGFKNISQTLRRDSEELFNSWLMNGEIPGFSSTNIAHRSRQASRRISTELAVSSHQNGVGYQKRSSDDNLCQPNLCMVEELSNDISHSSLRNAAEKGPSNLYLAKAWFHSTQPMTRSRSSELRRRYAAMQNSQTPIIVEAPNNTQVGGTNKMEQAFGNPSSLCDIPPGDMSSQLQTFISPSNSSSSPFNTPSMATVDTVSSVVSMLKGTLERKKLVNQADKEGNSFHFYSSQEVTPHIGSNQDTATHIIAPPKTFHGLSPIQLKETGNWSKSERSVGLNMEGYVMPPSQIQLGTMSREPSPSESSAAAPVHSTGFEVCDGPAYSGQALSICESSRKHTGNGTPEHESKTREFRERICESNLKNDRKKGSLARMGSISSGCSVDKGDPTKKRRVERSRKMAEAKERNSVPMLPSDMQSVLKRCETLEKEVRSLKLNLSFMNRKDSEQTKQIEELQKQNEELSEEKERLLEEIERIISDPHKM